MTKKNWDLNRIDRYGDYTLQYSILSNLFCIWRGLVLIKTFQISSYSDAVCEIRKLSGIEKPQDFVFPMDIAIVDSEIGDMPLYGNVEGDNLLSSMESPQSDLPTEPEQISNTSVESDIEDMESEVENIDKSTEG